MALRNVRVPFFSQGIMLSCVECVRRQNGLRNYSKQSSFKSYLKRTIQVSGPITVAAYMKEALTNPKWGYYMHRDVFGKSGDFITSPEICQMFGELIGVWFLNQWLLNGKPSKVNIVELGPGRGTLMADMLRVLSQFAETKDVFSVHLVEVSPEMRSIQRKTLKALDTDNQKCCYKCEVAKTPKDVLLYWYERLQEVPEGYTFLVAHEFFDALPVHQFQMTEKGWREILVDLDPQNDDLRFVLASGPSLVAEAFIPKSQKAQQCEVCPDAAVILEHATSVIERNGGAALIVDYGEERSHYLSLRGFKQHEVETNVLKDPGELDITANVDFGFLEQAVKDKVAVYGPVTQSNFLKAMGIDTRLSVLLRKANWHQAKDLFSAYDYLMNEEKMGDKFKFLSLVHRREAKPAGF